ncbi:DUF4870 domain-containing protein [Candidatus Lucifugimonas marina]|jgi:uncharacterized membrane protein
MKYTYNPEDNDKDEDQNSNIGDETGASDRSGESQITSLGINQNMEAVLAYVLGWVTGVAFLLIEKENKFVRFHAMQSIAVFVPITIASFILGFIPVIGAVFSTLLSIFGLFLWLFLMFQAITGSRYKVPYAGDFAEKQLMNMGTK